jgi:adenosylcobinamide kinase/adenosylcobinamide-phosphate guanylyltransferase
VHAVHLGHDNPPPPELDAVLAGWGATRRATATCCVGDGAGAARPAGGRVLVLGGARSGKSAYAEQRLAASRPSPTSRRRPPRRTTPSGPPRAGPRPPPAGRLGDGRDRDVAGAAATAREPLLVDDLGLWLVRAVDAAGAWEGPAGRGDAACDDLVAAWQACRGAAVLVAPEVGSGVVPATASGRRFRDLLGALTTRLAAEADEVVQVVAGLPRRLR